MGSGQLKSSGSPILPIVSSTSSFSIEVPMELRCFNGLAAPGKFSEIAPRLLCALQLLPFERRVFLSYKRDESEAVAHQLFLALSKSGYRVFLDSISVPNGVLFQEYLWHEMLAADFAIILGTEGFLKSHWTQEEIARAQALGVTTLQINWPLHSPPKWTALAKMLFLERDDFVDGDAVSFGRTDRLTEKAIQRIVEEAESARTRSVASERDSIISEFLKSAGRNRIVMIDRDIKWILLKSVTGQLSLAFPISGIPSSLDFQAAHEIAESISNSKNGELHSFRVIHIDHGPLPSFNKHISWLNDHLPITALGASQYEDWLKTI